MRALLYICCGLFVVQTPRCVETMEGFSCVGVAAARNHTVILTKG